MTKIRFDTEFQALKDINKAMFETCNAMKSYAIGLKQALEDDDNNVFLNLYTTTNSASVHCIATLETTINANAAFISPHIYQQYKKILALCGEQYRHFDNCMDEILNGKELKTFTTDLIRINVINNEIDSRIDELTGTIGEYLDGLVVIG